MTTVRLETLDDPRLDPYRSLKTTNAVRDARLFIAEGPTVVERVLRSPFPVHSVMISDRKFPAFESRLRADVTVLRLRQDLAEQLIGFAFHCGVAACAARKPSPDIMSLTAGTGASLLLACDRVVDPENVGALIRIASAFGADGILFSRGSADPFSRRVLRVSMGNGLFLPIVETDNLPQLLRDLRAQRGYRIAGALLGPEARSLSRSRPAARTVMVFGNEYDGISRDASAELDERLTIPMWNATDSLNVAVSAGIFCHEYRREFDAGGSGGTSCVSFPDAPAPVE